MPTPGGVPVVIISPAYTVFHITDKNIFWVKPDFSS